MQSEVSVEWRFSVKLGELLSLLCLCPFGKSSRRKGLRAAIHVRYEDWYTEMPNFWLRSTKQSKDIVCLSLKRVLMFTPWLATDYKLLLAMKVHKATKIYFVQHSGWNAG